MPREAKNKLQQFKAYLQTQQDNLQALRQSTRAEIAQVRQSVDVLAIMIAIEKLALIEEMMYI